MMMTPILYLIVGFVEWWLALRRTLACVRGEMKTLILIVFIENLAGLWVLSNFIRSNNWGIAIAYSLGASLGSYFVSKKKDQK
jgi:hypothetical protein